MFNPSLFPKKIEDLVPYTPDMSEYEVKLDANESTYSQSDAMREKIADIAKNFDYTKYPDPCAEKLVEAFSDFYGVDKKYVCAGNGSDELLSVIFSCFLQKGDTVLTFKPDFSMYAFYPVLDELSCIELEKDEKFNIDFERAQKVVCENNVKLVIFSNPCNPTGAICEKEKIEKFVRANPKTIFIIDEAYADFCDESYSFLSDFSKFENMIVLRTMSKAFGLASLRVGFAVGDMVVRDAFFKVKSPYNVDGLTQEIATAVLLNKEENILNIKKTKEDAKYLYESLENAKLLDFCVYQTSANFVFVKTSFAKVCADVLRKHSISIRSFVKGEGGFLRITAPRKSDTDRIIKILKEKVQL